MKQLQIKSNNDQNLKTKLKSGQYKKQIIGIHINNINYLSIKFNQVHIDDFSLINYFNSTTLLNKLSNRVGVYIFFDSNNCCIYVGKCGTKKPDKNGVYQDLEHRVSQYKRVKPTPNKSTWANTLAKNYLAKNSGKTWVDYKNFISSCTLIVISIPIMSNNIPLLIKNVDLLLLLERALIAKFNPFYNID